MNNTKMNNKISKIKQIDFSNYSESQILKTSKGFIDSYMLLKSDKDFIYRVFALVYEVIKRTLNVTPYDSQLLAALEMADYNIIELPTGEGKTIVAAFVAYLNALEKKGIHVLTFNDYLAKRDALWLKPVYDLLGVSADYISENKTKEERKRAYGADITYITVKEAGYDYLRSFLAYDIKDIIQRPFHVAIVDEADSIMIDNARIPLIITGDKKYKLEINKRINQVVSRCEENIHYKVNYHSNSIYLTDGGYDFLEHELGVSLSDKESINLMANINVALKAYFQFKKDKNYIVKNNCVFVIDEFTGRVMKDCKFPDGIQSAIELKENISVQPAESIMNRITIQSFLNLYPTLCGMTGTGFSSSHEFDMFYNKVVKVIPPNKPCIRVDHKDCVFVNKKTKYRAILDKIFSIHKTGRPILIGTGSIKESEELASVLKDRIDDIQVLNAKNDEAEALIIENAGNLNAVTISTNMAGRGVDIRLGGNNGDNYDKIVSLGGLYIIGTNRHESVRIDNQLRGRSGRQGDPGESIYYISLEDDFFSKYDIYSLIPKKVICSIEGSPIKGKRIDKIVTHVQKMTEGKALDVKISLSKYSMLYEKQRKIIDAKRKYVLENGVTLVEINKAFSENLCRSLPAEELASSLKLINLYAINECFSEYLLFLESALEEVQLIGKSTSNPFDFYNEKIIIEFEKFDINYIEKVKHICHNLVIRNGKFDLGAMGIHPPASTKTYMLLDGSEELNLVNELASVISPVSAVMFVFSLLLKHYKKLFKKKFD